MRERRAFPSPCRVPSISAHSLRIQIYSQTRLQPKYLLFHVGETSFIIRVMSVPGCTGFLPVSSSHWYSIAKFYRAHEEGRCSLSLRRWYGTCEHSGANPEVPSFIWLSIASLPIAPLLFNDLQTCHTCWHG